MKIGIFGKLDRPAIAAAYTGAETLGFRPRLENPHVWRADQLDPSYDLVVVEGLNNARNVIRNDYQTLGIPVLVIEQGHLKRGEYHQVNISDINWLPDYACPSDRRIALGLKASRRKRPEDGYVLVLGQKPGDAQHPITDMHTWAADCLHELRDITKREIVWRPHPMSPIDVFGFDATHYPVETKLDADFDHCHAVVTYNSNAGLLAAVRGVPVFCDPACWYEEICQTELEEIDVPTRLTRKALDAFLNRVAYAQWTLAEIRQGCAYEFLIPQLFEEDENTDDATEDLYIDSDLSAPGISADSD